MLASMFLLIESRLNFKSFVRSNTKVHRFRGSKGPKKTQGSEHLTILDCLRIVCKYICDDSFDMRGRDRSVFSQLYLVVIVTRSLSLQYGVPNITLSYGCDDKILYRGCNNWNDCTFYSRLRHKFCNSQINSYLRQSVKAKRKEFNFISNPKKSKIDSPTPSLDS